MEGTYDVEAVAYRLTITRRFGYAAEMIDAGVTMDADDARNRVISIAEYLPEGYEVTAHRVGAFGFEDRYLAWERAEGEPLYIASGHRAHVDVPEDAPRKLLDTERNTG